MLTGISKSRFPASYGVDGENIENQGIPQTHANADSTSHLGELLKFDFTSDVNAGVNMAVIRRASKIVHDQQKVSVATVYGLCKYLLASKDRKSCVLPFTSVEFTYDDVEGFGKECYRRWRRKLSARNDSSKAARMKTHQRTNRRAERQHRVSLF